MAHQSINGSFLLNKLPSRTMEFQAFSVSTEVFRYQTIQEERRRGATGDLLFRERKNVRGGRTTEFQVYSGLRDSPVAYLDKYYP